MAGYVRMDGVMEPTFHKLDNYGDIILVLDEQDAAYEDNEDFYTLFELPSPINEEQIEENLPDPSLYTAKKGRKKKASGMLPWEHRIVEPEPVFEVEPEPEPEIEPEPAFEVEPEPEPEPEVEPALYWPGESQERTNAEFRALVDGNEADKDEFEEMGIQAADNLTPHGLSHLVRFQVSSKHLTLASPAFEIMLKRVWSEAHTLNTQGSAELRALGTTLEALRIFLNAVYGRTYDIP
ncbi:uncharacterized protein GIQ15_01951 [Arthroderma uncinatum]|uniref:uncharacterized protein n=1 Tax=Arthroderma uncinatum TaxID=74035 RepID=UPI00144A5CA0|nr:uncharacterized protein GIQ15_01951 [Arthroderma uncinatum]KAF3492434.1 hypothetical protein GIQ15_01951 [Arthroderma uncinatum]